MRCAPLPSGHRLDPGAGPSGCGQVHGGSAPSVGTVRSGVVPAGCRLVRAAAMATTKMNGLRHGSWPGHSADGCPRARLPSSTVPTGPWTQRYGSGLPAMSETLSRRPCRSRAGPARGAQRRADDDRVVVGRRGRRSVALDLVAVVLDPHPVGDVVEVRCPARCCRRRGRAPPGAAARRCRPGRCSPWAGCSRPCATPTQTPLRPPTKVLPSIRLSSAGVAALEVAGAARGTRRSSCRGRRRRPSSR